MNVKSWIAFILCVLVTSTAVRSEESILHVMTYNIYRGGIMRGQPLAQTANVILKAKADVVGIQETRSPKGLHGEDLAKLLGWNLCVDRRNKCILTRHEIVERYDGGIKVKLDSGDLAHIFNLHLASNPYQPYQLLKIKPKWHKHQDTSFLNTEAEAIAAAREARGKEVFSLLEQIRSLSDSGIPVFVVGDFNEPSHLDWTEAATRFGRHPMKVQFPASRAMANDGFLDAWRTVYPDEIKMPGHTWSPLTSPGDPKDHHDRIDFVYYRGQGVRVQDAKIIGEDKESADIVVSPYPSDHRAVVVRFMISKSIRDESKEAAIQSR